MGRNELICDLYYITVESLIPRITYTEEDLGTWRAVYNELMSTVMDLFPK